MIITRIEKYLGPDRERGTKNDVSESSGRDKRFARLFLNS